MNSSSYYAAKVQEFKNSKAQLTSAISSVLSCGDGAIKCNNYTKDVILDNDVFDKGSLTKFSASLVGVAADLNTIRAECDVKIVKYQILYEIALRLERMKEQFDL